MSKKLAAYFSAGGVTEQVAKMLSEAAGADLFEIEPVKRYTKEDLDWRNASSRSTVEMQDISSRPPMAKKVENPENYDTVFVGFPIWWYVAPRIILTFLESMDLSGKTVIPFATPGGSDMAKIHDHLLPFCQGAQLLEGKLFTVPVDEKEMADFVSRF